jgi:CheY-like chemotaxis protein
MGARILVVDDSVTIQKVVELTLSKEDFVLVQARNGEEGLRKAMEVRPDLVLLDILMPDKDGYEVCAALRAQPALRNVPVILLTGTFEVYDKEKAAKVGADDFVTKPFESQVLIGKVKKLLFTRSLTARAPSGSMGAVGRPPVAELSLANVAVEAPAPPPEASRASGLSAPSLELSQDQLWQLLEAPPPPPPPAAAALDLSLDTLEPPPAAEPTEAELPEAAALDLETAAAEPEPPPLAAAALDLNLDALEPPPAAEPTEAELPEAAALDLETAAAEPGIPPAAPGALELEAFQPTEEAASTRLGDLSLDDLLAGAVESPADPGTAGPAAEETAEGEQVFDLTPSLDMPPLAMVEAGTGEPPSLSIEELLSSIEKGTPLAGAPAEAGAGPPEVDLSAVLSSEESAGSAADAADESAEPILDMELPGIEAAQPSAAPPAEPIAGIARVGRRPLRSSRMSRRRPPRRRPWTSRRWSANPPRRSRRRRRRPRRPPSWPRCGMRLPSGSRGIWRESYPRSSWRGSTPWSGRSCRTLPRS